MGADAIHTGLNAIESLGLSAATGLRVFIPLGGMALAAHILDYPIHSDGSWLFHPWVICLFVVLAILEMVAYYIPYLDNLIDIILTPMAIVFGVVVYNLSSTEIEHNGLRWIISLVVGGGVAGGIQALSVMARSLSTQTTGGFGNVFIASTELGGALVLTLAAIFAPLALIGVLGFMYVFMRWGYRQIRLQHEFERHLHGPGN